MKRITLILTILSTLIAATAYAQKIELYADATMSSCELVDQGTTLMSVHYFYTGPNSYGVRFRAPLPACWVGAIWAGDISPYPTIENSQSDWSIGFGSCLNAPVYLGNSNYFATGGALPCCEIVAMQPGGGFPFVYVDCDFNELPLTAGQNVVINPDDTCRCQNPLAVEATTWGRIKSLYR